GFVCSIWLRDTLEDREPCKVLAGAAASPDGSAESHSQQSPGGGNSINILHKAEKIESLKELPTCICLSYFSSGEERKNSKHVILISQVCRDLQSGLTHLPQ
ncbi:unnamed protein product, partial [Bubo scandiacus]